MALAYDQLLMDSALIPSPKNLSDLRVLSMPEGGTDRLSFTAWDTIEVLGVGEDTVELSGYYMIERADPTSSDWVDGSVDIAMRELNITGVSQMFGPIRASVNYEIGKPSRGQVQPGTLYKTVDSPKMCEMQAYTRFELSAIPVTVFNKEPIVLQHSITHIPPIGQGGGTRGRIDINLYRLDDPDGLPVAVLHQVKTHIGAWLR
jgi:uncharacterized protein DUF6073